MTEEPEYIEADLSYMEVTRTYYRHCPGDLIFDGWKVYSQDEFLILHHESESMLSIPGQMLIHKPLLFIEDRDNLEFKVGWTDTNTELSGPMGLFGSVIKVIGEHAYAAIDYYRKNGAKYERV